MIESFSLKVIENVIVFNSFLKKTTYKVLLVSLEFMNYVSSSCVLLALELYIFIKTRSFPDNKALFSSRNIKEIAKLNVCSKRIERASIIKKTLPYLLATKNKILVNDIKECSDKLSDVTSKIDDPLILMPLHILSDTAAMLTIAISSTKHNNVIIISDDVRGRMSTSKIYDTLIKNKITLIPIDNKNSTLVNILTKVRSGKESLTIFPDILPEYTSRQMGNKKQRYIKEKIFDKDAFIHEGPAAISKMTSATIVPFYVYENKRRIEIKILPKIQSSDIQDELAGVIESSLTEKPEQWMLWHYISFFYYRVNL
ncbi:hypothetical protein ACPV4H_17920 [Vibrio rotiferianus]|uniref:LpxL/LpxP family acyltransferase n=1 Tax=Vibrio rotiferianus TaxID=190895 RepID=UPI00406A6112